MEELERPVANLPVHRKSQGGSKRPLSGIRVIDFTHFVAGPYCTMILGDLGAEVIKIESVSGEDFRQFPPADPALNGEGAPFLWANRNKKSVAINLKSPQGISVVKDLVKNADVVVENFSYGVMERFGIGYEDLKEIKDDIIYCAISAYGREGPYAKRLGFDTIVQAESGFMSLNGFPDREGVRVQPVVMDTSTAMMAANGILAAVLNKVRSGGGQRVDVSLYETSLNMLGYTAMQYLMSGLTPSRVGNSSNDTAPTGVFYTSDGAGFFVSSSNTKVFKNIFKVVGRDDVAEDPDLQDRMGRLERKEELYEILQAEFKKHPWPFWEPKLRNGGVPAGKLRSVAEAFDSEETRASNIVTKVEHPTAGFVPNIALPLKFSETPVVDPTAAPVLGQHTKEVLEIVLGYDDNKLRELEEAGVF